MISETPPPRRSSEQLFQLHCEAARWRGQAAELAVQLEAARRENESLRRSLSWRLTAPLRAADAGLRSLRKFPRGLMADGAPGPAPASGTLECRRGGGVVAVDCSLTVRGRLGPGMRRVSGGFLRGSAAGGAAVHPVDLLGGSPHQVVYTDEGILLGGVMGVLECEVFLMLDSCWDYMDAVSSTLARLHESGVPVAALVHDTVPLDYPEHCLPDVVRNYRQWLEAVFEHCGYVACVSAATADRLRKHLIRLRPDRREKIEIRAWLPGSETWTGVPPEDEVVPEGDFLLCVGTVEPRKNYAFLLEAMSRLWAEGRTNSSLVIFGRAGWGTRDFIHTLLSHPEWGRRLWWFDGGSDRHLHALYASCRALAVPSIEEGFSQPLSEASALGKPVLLSDVPVFRERVLSGRYFFTLQDSSSLQAALLEVLLPGAAPTIVARTTWIESARSLVRDLLAWADTQDVLRVVPPPRTFESAFEHDGLVKAFVRGLPGRPPGWGPPTGVFEAIRDLRDIAGAAGEVVQESQRARPAAPGSVAMRTGLRPELQQPHPVFWRRFDQVHVVGRGNSPVDRRGRVAFEGFMTEEGLREEGDFNYWLLPPAKKLRGKFTSLNNARFAGDNYYHWLHDCLSKAMLLERLPPDTRILVGNPGLPFKRRPLELLGLWERVVPSESSHYFIDEFYYLPPICLSGGYNPDGLRFLRQRLLPRSDPANGRRIFVTRRTRSRSLINLEEVEQFFRGLGWEVVDAARMDFAEQVDVFHRADRVCGLHGAAMTNLLWCQPGTRVLEIFPGDYLNACYEIVADSLGLDYGAAVLSDHGPEPARLDVRQLLRSHHRLFD